MAHQHVRLRPLGIEQQFPVLCQNEEIGQPLALRRQQGRPHGTARHGAGHVVGNQALQEGHAIRTGNHDHAAVGKMSGLCHGIEVVVPRELRKTWRRREC